MLNIIYNGLKIERELCKKKVFLFCFQPRHYAPYAFTAHFRTKKNSKGGVDTLKKTTVGILFNTVENNEDQTGCLSNPNTGDVTRI